MKLNNEKTLLKMSVKILGDAGGRCFVASSVFSEESAWMRKETFQIPNTYQVNEAASNEDKLLLKRVLDSWFYPGLVDSRHCVVSQSICMFNKSIISLPFLSTPHPPCPP